MILKKNQRKITIENALGSNLVNVLIKRGQAR